MREEDRSVLRGRTVLGVPIRKVNRRLGELASGEWSEETRERIETLKRTGSGKSLSEGPFKSNASGRQKPRAGSP